MLSGEADQEMLPPLPQGVMPSYIQYLDVIQSLEKRDVHVKVSDISDELNIPRPGVTRTVKEMEKKAISARSHPRMMDVSLTYPSQKKDGSFFISMMNITSASCLRI